MTHTTRRSQSRVRAQLRWLGRRRRLFKIGAAAEEHVKLELCEQQEQEQTTDAALAAAAAAVSREISHR